MLKAIYIFKNDYENSEFRAKLNSKFAQSVTFLPISFDNQDNFRVFSPDEAINLLQNGKENELIKAVMAKFDSIKAEFIIVVGSGDELLDSVLARNLNAPFLLSKQNAHKAKLLGFKSICDIDEINNLQSNYITPIKFETLLYQKVAQKPKRVVLPESDDDRILKACDILLRSNAVGITLLGDKGQISQRANELGLNLDKADIINPATSDLIDEFATTLYELRKSKGMELAQAKELIKDRTYFGTMLVYKGLANAMVSGASTTTAQTIRPALQFVKTKPGVTSVSGSFIMCANGQIHFYADCAIMPNPTPKDLAGAAIATAATAREFGFEPKVAMLSYSTGDSGSGPSVDTIIEATKILKELDPSLDVEGPIQFDAAIDPVVAAKKLPNSKVAGSANVFIFPDLNCGNICYKAVQRTANALAIGPILQGLNKPINDLSRGCLVEDIVNTALISAIQGE
ncbi:phosphate acetyltransferase [Campylobacter vicugnae]|uniref:phosphate acetyltransferase n=1 Tax=Campylobacter vicugnae TaxID=1660076 RepID=UPI00254E8AEF|nr:phosphate acetyltransferase [Campylobacter ovis]MDL0105359.1 phosphate acetyltransferase [Campylobacter ovis]MDL0106778.1 phosphate acetyltransferase [Campylobacter ovis]